MRVNKQQSIKISCRGIRCPFEMYDIIGEPIKRIYTYNIYIYNHSDAIHIVLTEEIFQVMAQISIYYGYMWFP